VLPTILRLSSQRDGARRVMALAVEEAGLQPRDVDYVNTHGTSTPLAILWRLSY
jgi:3-oxoacyl-(acyl-carrier-protein) synthase